MILRGDLRRRREAYSRTITSSYPDSYHLLVSTTTHGLTARGALFTTKRVFVIRALVVGQLSRGLLEGVRRAAPVLHHDHVIV